MTTGAPDYFKRTLLYGLYDGTPVPLACDAQGRLILISETDVSPWDKSGDILIKDTFKDGIKACETFYSGTGGGVTLDTTECLVDGQSCRMTGGSDAGREARITYRVAPSHIAKFGFEVAIRWGDNIESVALGQNMLTGPYVWSTFLEMTWDDDVWRLYDNNAGWVQIISGMGYSVRANHFHRFKLVADSAVGKYTRFVYDGQEVPLTAYIPLFLPESHTPRIDCWIYVKSKPGLNGWILVDNVIITQRES